MTATPTAAQLQVLRARSLRDGFAALPYPWKLRHHFTGPTFEQPDLPVKGVVVLLTQVDGQLYESVATYVLDADQVPARFVEDAFKEAETDHSCFRALAMLLDGARNYPTTHA